MVYYGFKILFMESQGKNEIFKIIKKMIYLTPHIAFILVKLLKNKEIFL